MEEKQELIVKAAESQFVRFGFRKTTMEDIAKAAGIGKATLYYYFKSKEDIFAAMIETVAQPILQHMQNAILPDSSPPEKLRQYVLTQVRQVKEKADYYVTLRDEYLDIFPLIQKERKNLDQQAAAMLRNLFAEGVAQQVFAIENIEATIRIFQLLLQELIERLILEENSATLNEDIELFLNVMLKGLEVRD